MYETTCNFTGSRFQLTPDTRFFYGSRRHSRAIAHPTFGLAQGEGFIIVTGDDLLRLAPAGFGVTELEAGKATLLQEQPVAGRQDTTHA